MIDRKLPEAEQDWERRWAPYDPLTYQAVLERLHPTDTILEIGAGDLRLARQMAEICKKVYAIEIQPDLVRTALRGSLKNLPANLIPILGDARFLPFPGEITTGVLLMRHCTHFRLYAEKLKAVGCIRLITNARWRMGVETVLLQAPRQPYRNVTIGWYACWCGSIGFVAGDAGLLTPGVEATVHEVANCPRCRDLFRRCVQ